MRYDYEIFKEGNKKMARVQSAGMLDLTHRDGSDEEAIKNFIASVQNVKHEDIELNKTELNSGVVTSNDATQESRKANLKETVKRNSDNK